MTTFQNALDHLNCIIEQRRAVVRNPAMSVAITDRDGVIHSACYGHADLEKRLPVNPNTLFEIGSIGKTFTAVAILQAQEARLLDVHQPVQRYLPWFKSQSAHDPITLHHLLTHSAGLNESTDDSPDPLAEVWEVRKTEIKTPPGERFYYSNLGYKVLGLVLEQIYGRPYAEIIDRGILLPLKMFHTRSSITHDVYPRLAIGYQPLYDDRPAHPTHPLIPAPWLETNSGDGCIVSTAEDMCSFMRMLLNYGKGPNGPVLSSASFRQLTQRWINLDEETCYGYGLNLFEDEGSTFIGHFGDMPGYEAGMLMDLDNGIGVSILMATPHVPRLSLFTVRLIKAAACGAPDLPLPPAVPDPLFVENAADYAGAYHCDDWQMGILAENERLYMEYLDQRIPLEKRGEDAFYANHPDFDRFLLTFGRDESTGKVIEAFHGPDWYVNERYVGLMDFVYPVEWDSYVGHYRAHNPWLTNFRVIVRKGRLLLVKPDGSEESLTPVGQHTFSLEDETTSPEWIEFSWFANRRALRAKLSGGRYYRFFTP